MPYPRRDGSVESEACSGSHFTIPTDEQVQAGVASYPIIGADYVYEREYKQKGRVYIIDDPRAFKLSRTPSSHAIDDDSIFVEAEEQATGLASPAATVDHDDTDAQDEYDSSPNKVKCDIVRQFFEKKSVYTVVRMKPLPDLESWEQYWEHTIQTFKKDELIIIYFFGDAGGNGPRWKWLMRGDPQGDAYEMSAYKFIRSLCKHSKADVLVMAECYYATRMQERVALIRELAKHKHAVEVMCSGQAGQDTKGSRSSSNYTDKILNTLQRVIMGTFERPVYCPPAAFSVPQMMMGEESWDSNPYRMGLTSKKRVNGDKKVWRIRMDPVYIREKGKLVFHRDCVHDLKKLEFQDRCMTESERAEIEALTRQVEAQADDEGYYEDGDSEDHEKGDANMDIDSE